MSRGKGEPHSALRHRLKALKHKELPSSCRVRSPDGSRDGSLERLRAAAATSATSCGDRSPDGFGDCSREVSPVAATAAATASGSSSRDRSPDQSEDRSWELSQAAAAAATASVSYAPSHEPSACDRACSASSPRPPPPRSARHANSIGDGGGQGAVAAKAPSETRRVVCEQESVRCRGTWGRESGWGGGGGGGERWPGPCDSDPRQRGLETFEVFVEGTRSRDRRFLAPRTGLLRALQVGFVFFFYCFFNSC